MVAVTGRPAGWSEPFALAWPVNAIIAENGGVALEASRQKGPQPNGYAGPVLSKKYRQDEGTRAADRQRLRQVAARLLREVPGAALARDSAGRETDIAIDHSEFARLPPERIAEVVRIMHSEGLHATVSSIHINGWFGPHDKWQGACWIVRELWGRELEAETDRWAFIGDSANDAPMFRAFAQSIGVANIRRFLPQLDCKPRYITSSPRGAGFAEAARAILAAQGAAPAAAATIVP